jgi:hypothetical protein
MSADTLPEPVGYQVVAYGTAYFCRRKDVADEYVRRADLGGATDATANPLYTADQMRAALAAQAEAHAKERNRLMWLYTHCRSIGMDKKSDSGLQEHDIALFTIDLKTESDALRAEVADLKELLNREFGAGWEDWDAATLRHVSRERDTLRVLLAGMQQDCKDAGNALGEVEQENDALRAQVEALRASIKMGDSKQQETI